MNSSAIRRRSSGFAVHRVVFALALIGVSAGTTVAIQKIIANRSPSEIKQLIDENKLVNSKIEQLEHAQVSLAAQLLQPAAANTKDNWRITIRGSNRDERELIEKERNILLVEDDLKRGILDW